MARLIRIKVQPHAIGGRFCRAGRCFGTEFTTLTDDELTPEQLALIQADPMLAVDITEAEEPATPQTKAEAKAKAEAKPAKESGK